MATGPWFVVARTPIFTAVESETGDKLLRSFASMGRWLAAAGGAPVPKSGGENRNKEERSERKFWGTPVAAREGSVSQSPRTLAGSSTGSPRVSDGTGDNASRAAATDARG